MFDPNLLAPPRVVICNPELLKQVTVTDSQKFERSDVAKILFPSIGNGLFTSNGRDHALQRKMIGPAFYYNSLKDMVTVFEDNVQNIVKVRWVFNIAHGTTLRFGALLMTWYWVTEHTFSF